MTGKYLTPKIKSSWSKVPANSKGSSDLPSTWPNGEMSVMRLTSSALIGGYPRDEGIVVTDGRNDQPTNQGYKHQHLYGLNGGGVYYRQGRGNDVWDVWTKLQDLEVDVATDNQKLKLTNLDPKTKVSINGEGNRLEQFLGAVVPDDGRFRISDSSTAVVMALPAAGTTYKVGGVVNGRPAYYDASTTPNMVSGRYIVWTGTAWEVGATGVACFDSTEDVAHPTDVTAWQLLGGGGGGGSGDLLQSDLLQSPEMYQANWRILVPTSRLFVKIATFGNLSATIVGYETIGLTTTYREIGWFRHGQLIGISSPHALNFSNTRWRGSLTVSNSPLSTYQSTRLYYTSLPVAVVANFFMPVMGDRSDIYLVI